MMIRNHRFIGYILLFITLFTLSACAQEQPEMRMPETEAPVAVVSQEQSGIHRLNWDEIETVQNGAELDHRDVMAAETKEEALSVLKAILEDVRYPYSCILRDAVYSEGKLIPGLWVFAVNTQGETLDILLVDKEYKQDLMSILPGKNNAGLRFYRKNESVSFAHAWHYPEEFTGIGECSQMTSENGQFIMLWSGQALSMFDIRDYWVLEEILTKEELEESGEAYWNGNEWLYGTRRPEIESPFAPDPAYPTYDPASSMEEEIQAVQKRLKEADETFEWEIMDKIELDGTEYSVTWMYARNASGQWVDAVFSTDTELCYLLYDQQEAWSGQREGEQPTLDSEWLILDVFFHGYSCFMQGNLEAIQACGSPYGG